MNQSNISRVSICQDLIQNSFDAADMNRDGFIDRIEYLRMMQLMCHGTENEFDRHQMDFDFDDADIDHDNKLNFQEFYRILSGFNGDSKDLDSLDDYYNRMTDHEFEELVRILNEDLAKLRITSARYQSNIADSELHEKTKLNESESCTTLTINPLLALISKAVHQLPTFFGSMISHSQGRLKTVKDLIRKSFDAVDDDKNGLIDVSEYKNMVIKMGCPTEEVDAVVAHEFIEADINSDGTISFQEYFTLLSRYHGDINDELALSNYFEEMETEKYFELVDNLVDILSKAQYSSYSMTVGSHRSSVVTDLVRRLYRNRQAFQDQAVIEYLEYMDAEQFLSMQRSLAELCDLPHVAISELNKRAYRTTELRKSIAKIFDAIDLDKNGYIDLSELKASFFHRFEKMKQRKLTRTDSIKVEEATKKAHASMDLDADGKVDFEELFHFLCMDGFEGDPNDKVEVEKFLKKMDDNSYAELLSFIENYAEGVF